MTWPGHGVATTGPRGKREGDSTRSRSSIETSTPPSTEASRSGYVNRQTTSAMDH